MLDFKKFLEDVGEIFNKDNTVFLPKVDSKNTESIGKKHGVRLNLKKKFGFELSKDRKENNASNNCI